MSFFSHVNLEIRKWLKLLRRKLGEHLCLVIADHTDFEIPWEMVELSPYESPNEYLGALIATVRWRQIIRGDDCLVLEFKAEESLRSPNLSVAALLRKLRFRVVENLPEQPTTQDLLPFIYTFMYVYYGNPMTVLRLSSPREQLNV